MVGRDDYLLLMCDGITGCLSNQEIVDFVHKSISSKMSAGSNSSSSSSVFPSGAVLSDVWCEFC